MKWTKQAERRAEKLDRQWQEAGRIVKRYKAGEPVTRAEILVYNAAFASLQEMVKLRDARDRAADRREGRRTH